MAAKQTAMFVKGVPADLKQRLIDMVDGDELSSLNDVIVMLLARHYGTAFEPSGYQGKVAADPSVPNIEVRLPTPLYRRIAAERLDRRLRGDRVRQADLVIGILTDQLAAA